MTVVSVSALKVARPSSTSSFAASDPSPAKVVSESANQPSSGVTSTVTFDPLSTWTVSASASSPAMARLPCSPAASVTVTVSGSAAGSAQAAGTAGATRPSAWLKAKTMDRAPTPRRPSFARAVCPPLPACFI